MLRANPFNKFEGLLDVGYLDNLVQFSPEIFRQYIRQEGVNFLDKFQEYDVSYREL